MTESLVGLPLWDMRAEGRTFENSYRIKIFLFIFLGASALILSCGSKEDESGVTIVFKHGKIAGQTGHLSELIRKFEEENPGIRVKEEVLPSLTDQQHQFYVTNLEAGASDFDLFSLDVIWVPEFARAGWLEDVSDLIIGEERALLLPGPLQACLYQEKLYAVPWYADGGLLYFRKDLLEKYQLEPPQTFPELEAAVKLIRAREKNPELAGFVWQGKQYEGLVCVALEFIEGNCGHILDQDGRVRIGDSAAVRAVSYMRELIQKGVTPEYVTTADEEMTRHAFRSGRAIFMRNWPYAYNLFQEPDSKVRNKVGIAIMPHFPGCRSASTLGGWQLGINKFSNKKEAAKKLITFLTSYQSEKFLALKAGFKPSRKDVYSDSELIAQQPFIAELYQVLSQAVPRPVSPYYAQISMVLQEKFSAAIAGTKSPPVALQEAQNQFSQLLSSLK